MEIVESDLKKIASFPLFEGINRTELVTLLQGGRVKAHNHRGAFVEFGQTASVFGIVLDGAYKLIKPTPRGEDFIMYIATSGDAVGALLMGQTNAAKYPLTVKALGFSRICIIPKETFQTVWRTHAQILMRMNSILYSRMGILQDEKTLVRAPLIQRVAWFLLKMLERCGDSEEQIIPLPLTRQEIADHLGVTVESVIRVMSQWAQSGIVKTTDGQIEILQVERLVEILKELE